MPARPPEARTSSNIKAGQRPRFFVPYIATKPLSTHFHRKMGGEGQSKRSGRVDGLVNGDVLEQVSVAQAQLWKRLRINPVFSKLLY